MTTGAHNVVVWTTHWNHKTSLYGGPHGFPDSSYCATTNAQFDWLGIPRWAPTDPIVHHDEIITYTAPTQQRPPTLPPNVLRPVGRAIPGGFRELHNNDTVAGAPAAVAVVAQVEVAAAIPQEEDMQHVARRRPPPRPAMRNRYFNQEPTVAAVEQAEAVMPFSSLSREQWALTLQMWHLLPNEGRRIMAQRYNYPSIDDFERFINEYEEHMSFQRALAA